MKPKRAQLALIALIVSLIMISAPVFGAIRSNPDASGDFRPAPNGYRHRPVVEFFTGLSCPSCMAGPHPDMEKLWEENGYDPQQDFTYVVFHELNGGGEDALQTADSEERMRFYQPGVSGTPDAEFDGGYIELGGMANNDGVDYASAKTAIENCKSRTQTTINPLHPIQSLRNGFKFVKLDVSQMFTGISFSVVVKAQYLGTSALIETKALNGLLYVFMVEDNITAYSKVEKTDVNNHNAFRGYAIKAKDFSLKNGESTEFAADWPIPTDAKVPINPANMMAIAVVYDKDDTTTENGNQGNRAGVPRALQSATPASTAFDNGNDIPRASAIKFAGSGSKVKVTATLDDSAGIASGFVLYNTQAANATNWTVAKMNISGSECEGDTCSVYKNATGTVTLDTTMDKPLFIVILLYDGNMTQGKIELMNITAGRIHIKTTILSIGGAGIVIVVVAVAAIGYYLWNKKKKAAQSVSESK